MFLTTVTLSRAGSTVASGLRVQVDQLSDKERVEHQDVTQRRGYDLFRIITMDWYPNSLIQRQDVLFDELIIDADTNKKFKYTVTSRPKNYVYDHQSLIVEVVPGA